MSRVCERWSLEELCDMTDDDMEELLRYYEPNKVPSLHDLRVGRDPAIPEFDWSFGWWI
jgi:precorrin-2 dehydrogenase/sirohydrochlorin ferrochelatase